MSKKVLFVFKSPIIKCPRPRRLLLSLKDSHQCFFLCPTFLDEKPDDSRWGYLSKAIQSPFQRWLHKKAVRLKWYWLAERFESARYRMPLVKDGEFDFVFVHDLFILPHFSHFTRTKVVFDAREYYPTEFADDPAWNAARSGLAEYTCKKHMPRVYKRLTVSPSIVNRYQDLIGMPVACFPSFPREELYIGPKSTPCTRPIRFIHHGNAFQNRGLERMVQLMVLLGEDFQLDMMLVANPGNQYFAKLQSMIADIPNVRIIPPVHPDAITRCCHEYDMGLYIMEVNDSQNRYCLPNKYFEFLFAGLPVITSFSEDMKAFTERYDLGLGFSEESLETIAGHIKSLSVQQIESFKLAIQKHAPHWTVAENIRSNLPELAASEG